MLYVMASSSSYSRSSTSTAMSMRNACIRFSSSCLCWWPVLAARLQAEVVTGIFSSVSDTYVWSVLAPDGSHRSVAVSQGERQEEGAPLPEEQGVGALDEETLFALLGARTGLGEDWLALPAYALVG